jgi:hypothetical protein
MATEGKVSASVYVIWYAAAAAALAGLLFLFPYPWFALVALCFGAAAPLLKALASRPELSRVGVREFFRVSSYVAVYAAASFLYEFIDLGSDLVRAASAAAYVAVLWINVSFFLRAPYVLQRVGATASEEGRKKILDVAVVFASWPLALWAIIFFAGLAFYYRGEPPVAAWSFVIKHYPALSAAIAAAYFLSYVFVVTRYRPATARRYHFGTAPAEDVASAWRPTLWALLAALPAALLVAYFSRSYDVPLAATIFAWLPAFYLALVARRPLAPEGVAEKEFNAVAFFIICIFSAFILPVIFAYAAQYLF